MSNWYRATLTDNMAKPTRAHCYVRSPRMADVDDIATGHYPDAWQDTLSSVAALPDVDDAGIRSRVANASSPNIAILEDGTLWRRDRSPDGEVREVAP